MPNERMRLRLILGKYPVVAIEGWHFGDDRAVLQLGDGATKMFFTVPAHGDLRVGDLLTIYTEIFMKERN